MWNQASAPGAAGAGSQPGGSGSFSNMTYTIGSFAPHARPTGLSNSPSAHRRPGGAGSSHHASPATSSAFPRTPFPGTVAAPRSAIPPNSVSAAQRTIQHLPAFTTRTPASLARLAYPPNTKVFWQRLERRAPTPAAAASQEQDLVASAGTASAGSFQEVCTAWDAGVKAVITSGKKSRSRSHKLDNAGLNSLLQGPLFYTSPARSPENSTAAEVWLFVATTDDLESTSDSIATGVEDPSSKEATADISGKTAAADPTGTSTMQKLTAAASSSPLDSAITSHLPSDVVKALMRLSAIASVTSGSYALASAAPTSLKGKESSLTSEQSKAHKGFMTAIKTRAIDRIVESARATKTSNGEPVDTASRAVRPRLRFGENFVFLPTNSADYQASTPADKAERYCLFTELSVSLCSTSFFVRATSRSLAAVPLASTRHAHAGPPSSGTSLLLAPLGCSAELLGVATTSSVAEEHLTELQSLFANLSASTSGMGSDDEALFASGLAICALPHSPMDPQSPQGQSQPPNQRQQEATHNVFASEEPKDEDMELSAVDQYDQPQTNQQDKQQRRHFLWPVDWALVVQYRASGPPCTPRSGRDDLQHMRSQPMTPLKELVSFTLKVLNDANENTFAQAPAPYTPGEADDASLTRQRADRLPSTRPEITPASIAFPDFDFAMPPPASTGSAQSVHAAGQSMQGSSPLKREVASTEPGQRGNSTEQHFHEDLSWMQFLPQSSEASAPVSTADSAMHIDALSGSGTAPTTNVPTKETQANAPETSWAFSMASTSAPPDVRPTTANASDSGRAATQGLLEPQGHMHSQGSTTFQANNTTPLGFAQPQIKRKAGETDIFGNLGLLTEDDFSFFDESAFGLEPDTGSMPQHLDQPTEAHDANFGQPFASTAHPGPSNAAISAQPATSAGTAVDDVAMEDLNPNSLDALFSAIPGLQDAMATADPAPPSTSTASVATQAAQSRFGNTAAQDAAPATASSTHGVHPVVSSFTPRDASSATPFGDPASLPGFTPSSLTESSPAFGNPSHKTPRTPYSPVEEYRDGATIVDLHNSANPQGYREHNPAASTVPADGAGIHPFGEQKPDEEFRLADASTAAAAAANAAMDTDASSRKRPAIVPNAFLPLAQGEARKPLQKLATSARASLGRKYDLLGKFASKPKTPVHTFTNSTPSTENLRADRASAPEQGRRRQAPLASQFGLGASRPSPSKTPSRRGQALLQLRRDRHSQGSPGKAALHSARRDSAQRMSDVPATPRSSDDVVKTGPEGFRSASDSDSESSGDGESEDDGSSSMESTMLSLSSEDQMALKSVSREVVDSYLRGAVPESPVGQLGGESKTSALRSASTTLLKPTVKRWMLSRTARWLIENPQFRSMYAAVYPSPAHSDIAFGEKVEVLSAFASALNLDTQTTTEVDASSAPSEAEIPLPTLQTLVKPSSAELADVLEPTQIAVGCQGSVVSALPSALALWNKSNFSAVSGQKHVVAKVLLTHASPAWHEEILSWLDRLHVAFSTHGLGTHSGGGPSSILSVADTSETLSLSSYLDRLYADADTWIDTLRSIASRIQLDLLQGKHVVVYTLQPPNSASCGDSGFHGLLRLERDLRGLLGEQVGVLAEQMCVRVVSLERVTEGGSLGFGRGAGEVRRLAMGVYDALPRLVRRQPAKVLHGRELGKAVSAVIQYPAFTLLANDEDEGREKRTKFELNWQDEPTTAMDRDLILHVAYRICSAGQRRQEIQQQDSSEQPMDQAPADAPFDASNIFGLDKFTPANAASQAPASSAPREKLVMVSAIDERAGSSTVDVFPSSKADSSLETCIELVWRFALAEASRARLRWRLTISSAGLITQREQQIWSRLITSYISATEQKDTVFGKVMLLSVRTEDSGSILTERGGRTKPNQAWTTADKSNSVLLDAKDYSQMLRFAEPLPLGWTQAFGAAEEEVELAMPVASAILVNNSRRELVGARVASGSQIHAVDLMQRWITGEERKDKEEEEKEEEVAMDAIVRSLHRTRLVSEERHQLPYPFNGQPWPVASVNTLAAHLEDVVLED